MAQNLLSIAAGGVVTEISTDYAPLASPTFTGTVGGITAAMVGGVTKAGDTGIGNLSMGALTATAASVVNSAGTASGWGWFEIKSNSAAHLVLSTARGATSRSWSIGANQVMEGDFVIAVSTTNANAPSATRFVLTATGAGFNGTAAIAKPTITGSRGANAALASLLTALANYGLITDSTTA